MKERAGKFQQQRMPSNYILPKPDLMQI